MDSRAAPVNTFNAAISFVNAPSHLSRMRRSANSVEPKTKREMPIVDKIGDGFDAFFPVI